MADILNLTLDSLVMCPSTDDIMKFERGSTLEFDQGYNSSHFV